MVYLLNGVEIDANQDEPLESSLNVEWHDKVWASLVRGNKGLKCKNTVSEYLEGFLNFKSLLHDKKKCIKAVKG